MEAPARPLSRALRSGAAFSAALVLTLTLGTLLAVLWRAEGVGGLGPADWSALRFTLTQAAVSAALSLALAIPAARALARRRFPGRRLLITLLGAPFILPVIVAVMGILAVFGRSGFLNDGLAALGFARVSIYGFAGCRAGACLLQPAACGPALAARLARHPRRTLPAGGGFGLRPRRHRPASGISDAARPRAGRVRHDLPDLPYQFLPWR